MRSDRRFSHVPNSSREPARVYAAAHVAASLPRPRLPDRNAFRRLSPVGFISRSATERVLFFSSPPVFLVNLSVFLLDSASIIRDSGILYVKSIIYAFGAAI
ncbi:unnamed protein product [Musa banksii]